MSYIQFKHVQYGYHCVDVGCFVVTVQVKECKENSFTHTHKWRFRLVESRGGGLSAVRLLSCHYTSHARSLLPSPLSLL